MDTMQPQQIAVISAAPSDDEEGRIAEDTGSPIVRAEATRIRCGCGGVTKAACRGAAGAGSAAGNTADLGWCR